MKRIRIKERDKRVIYRLGQSQKKTLKKDSNSIFKSSIKG